MLLGPSRTGLSIESKRNVGRIRDREYSVQQVIAGYPGQALFKHGEQSSEPHIPKPQPDGICTVLGQTDSQETLLPMEPLLQRTLQLKGF